IRNETKEANEANKKEEDLFNVGMLTENSVNKTSNNNTLPPTDREKEKENDSNKNKNEATQEDKNILLLQKLNSRHISVPSEPELKSEAKIEINVVKPETEIEK